MAASVKASELMHRGTEMLKEKIEPDAEAPQIDPRLRTGLEVAKWTASKAAQGSGYLGNNWEINFINLNCFFFLPSDVLEVLNFTDSETPTYRAKIVKKINILNVLNDI